MTAAGRHAAPDPVAAAPVSAEHARLAESPGAGSPWRQWGAYVAARQWGTVREDYSAGGDAWRAFPFEHAHRRAYRWGEDGLAGICDHLGFLHLGLAVWNERDPLLKERLFGLTNAEGNHGEDVKEYWWPQDATPTHSWLRWVYRYPQAAYPYEQLRAENGRRGRDEREYELADTGVLAENRYFDVEMSVAKAAPDDLCIVYRAHNHGPDPAPLHLIPQVWFHNTWSWGDAHARPTVVPLPESAIGGGMSAVRCDHSLLGTYYFVVEGHHPVLVCDNETDPSLWGAPRVGQPKDAVNRRVVDGDSQAATAAIGTKAGVWIDAGIVAPGHDVVVRVRLSPTTPGPETFGTGFAAVLADRQAEADEFYAHVLPAALTAEEKFVARRAFSGLIWGQQFYRYDVTRWLDGDPNPPAPPAARQAAGARNVGWRHLALADVMTMPDEWEYPWFASWDLALQCVPLAHVDPAFAKQQLLLLGREWAMAPDGQLPAYEWAFGDANPPLHAWAAWQVYVADGRRDRAFLTQVFTKLLINSTWWINRKDADGSNMFEGGFLGMDNIGLFDRSAPLSGGARLEEADATGWMAFHFLAMTTIAIELGQDPSVGEAWDDLAVTYLERFLAIADRFQPGTDDRGFWSAADGFAYDVVVQADGSSTRLPVRSMVGLLPLLAVARAPEWTAAGLPNLMSRLRWWREHRPELLRGTVTHTGADGDDTLFSAFSRDQVQAVLGTLFDPEEFLSPHGIRSLSARYRTPFTVDLGGQQLTIDYEPGESRTGLFGGNSNWRGPVWFPVNVLLADALRTYGDYFGAELTVAVQGRTLTLTAAAAEIDRRLVSLFSTAAGPRPADGARIEAAADPAWRGQVTFYEYFDGDTGEGLGATHQTGWTALVAHLLCRRP